MALATVLELIHRKHVSFYRYRVSRKGFSRVIRVSVRIRLVFGLGLGLVLVIRLA